jgi:transcriptional regulator with XRE-family HTH domain
MTKRRKYYGRRSSKEFGLCLKSWRKNAKLTLHEASIRLGLECKSPEAYLSQIERGQRPIPERVLINVSNVYTISAEEVLKEAYSPQLTLPILAAITKPTALHKQIEDYLRDLEKELEDKDKEELAHYASFLLIRRKLNVTIKNQDI